MDLRNILKKLKKNNENIEKKINSTNDFLNPKNTETITQTYPDGSYLVTYFNKKTKEIYIQDIQLFP